MFLQLEIETLTFGGRGLARHAGKAVFVPHTAPGDLVRCQVVRDRTHYAEAEVREFLKEAPRRRVPPCPVAGICGGCDWQHLPYDQQTSWKDRLFREQLLRAGVATDDVVQTIAAAPAELGYRNRLQFKCRLAPGRFVSGFYRPASHYVVDTPNCLLALPAIQDTYAFLRRVLPGSPRPDAIPQVDIACGDDGRVTVLFHLLPDALDAMRRWLFECATTGKFTAAVQTGRKETIKAIAGDAVVSITVDTPPLDLRVGAGGFSQVNPAQNRRMVEAVIAAADLSGQEKILDLFCGVGNFSLPLARRTATVIGIENFAPAILDATGNALRHGINNVTFHTEPAEGAVLRHGPFDLVLLDPPRTGAYPVMRDLLTSKPRRILYVSCDPVTLTRDLQPLVHNGYRIVSARPFDFFPQTWHIESLTVLERCS